MYIVIRVCGIENIIVTADIVVYLIHGKKSNLKFLELEQAELYNDLPLTIIIKIYYTFKVVLFYLLFLYLYFSCK